MSNSNLDRSTAPAIHTIESVELPNVEQLVLDNGLKVYALNAGEEDVVKIEFVFKAGKWFENQNLVADLTARMLREGTTTKTGKELADFFDFYGSNFNTSSGNELASVSLYCLTKYLDVQLPVLFEIFTQASFPENELQTICTNRKQRLLIELEKNDFLANRYFSQALWGNQHPYGRITEAEQFDAINTTQLKTFYKQNFHAANGFVIIAGKFDNGILKTLNKIFDTKDWLENDTSTPAFNPEPKAELIFHEDRKNSVQSALQLGNITIGKTHPDFIKFTVMNTIFGGYFGSRLMSNIREEKGYTYGIHSSIASYPHGACIDISSEVGTEVRQATLDEIRNEIELMRTEEVDSEELETVKNYMSGRILRSVDGPLRYSDTLKGLLLYNNDGAYIHNMLKEVQSTNAQDVIQLANKYLNYDEMYKISVG